VDRTTLQAFQIEVEAMQLTDDLSIAAISGWIMAHGATPMVIGDERPFGLAIPTIEGTTVAFAGDWVIRGIKGEFYPCKPDVFADRAAPRTET
jgi:hypothetical protein